MESPQPSADRKSLRNDDPSPCQHFFSRVLVWLLPSIPVLPCDIRPCQRIEKMQQQQSQHLSRPKESKSHKPVPCFYMSRQPHQHPRTPRDKRALPRLRRSRNMCNTQALRVGTSAGAGAAIPAATPVLLSHLLSWLSPTRPRK